MEIETVVDRFFSAIEACDEAALREIYADDVGVWHNFTGTDQNKADNIARLARASSLAKLRYEVIDRFVVGDRLVQRHRLWITAEGRPDTPLHAALFITVRGGRIVHIDEYLDPAQVMLPSDGEGRGQ